MRTWFVRRALDGLRLPVLKKDLTELAARKRTYLIRFAYAALLFVTACTIFYGQIGLSATAGQTLGRGRDYFFALVTFQLAALYIVIPLLAAGAVTMEKERGTLPLLLLTTLTARQIVLQKFAGRMTPILSFLFLSFPLLAITYTFGGLTAQDLLAGILLLLFVSLELGGFAILCSTIFRTTTQAVAACYVGFPLACFCCAGPIGGVFQPESSLSVTAIVATGLCLFLTVAFLSLAEFLLIGRAYVARRRKPSGLLGWLDRRYEGLNQLAGGFRVAHDGKGLPRRAPLSWRASRKKPLGSVRDVCRILLLIDCPLLAFMIWIHRRGTAATREGTMATLLLVLWMLAGLLLGASSASLIAEERSRRTLDVLLSTPLPTRRIIEEKLSGLHRLMFVLAIPLATLFLFEQWWYGRRYFDYLILSGLTVALYLPVIQWLGVWVGLWMRSQLPAITVTLALLIGWTCGLASVLPLARYFHLETGTAGNTAFDDLILALSPVDMIRGVQLAARGTFPSHGILPSPSMGSPNAAAIHFALFTACYFLLRTWCLRYSDRHLGRIPQPGEAIP